MSSFAEDSQECSAQTKVRAGKDTRGSFDAEIQA